MGSPRREGGGLSIGARRHLGVVSKFAYAILENAESFGCIARDKDGAPAIMRGYGSAMDFVAEFVRDWGRNVGKAR